MSAPEPAAHPRRVVLAGGSGFLGASLARALVARGVTPVVLTRSPRPRSDGAIEVGWDGRTAGDWTRWLDGAEAVVNLAGKSVDCRPTAENRREITASRVDSVRAIGDALARCAAPPATWVQSSSLAIYGDAGERVCDEDAPHADGYPADVVVAWEDAFARALPARTRGVCLRIGFVLAAHGGALAVLVRLARRFLGGAVGSGRQWISWLHLADMDALFLRALDDARLSGTYNACAGTATNAELMRSIRRAVHRPWSPPVPRFLVRIGAWAMGSDANLALSGRRCVPRRLEEAGFAFRFTRLDDALADLRP